MVFSWFTMLVTDFQRQTFFFQISACIKFMHARELQFRTLRVLTIMLEMEEAMGAVQSMSSLTNNEISESIFEKEDLIEDF